MGAIISGPGGAITVLNALIPVAYDTVELTYTGEDVTGAVFKAGGNVVATLTLGYSGGKLVTVARI